MACLIKMSWNEISLGFEKYFSFITLSPANNLSYVFSKLNEVSLDISTREFYKVVSAGFPCVSTKYRPQLLYVLIKRTLYPIILRLYLH